MKKAYLLLFFSVLTVCVSIAYAQQRIPVQEGVEVNAVVSTSALNRIAVENDRILSVKGKNGDFQLDKDVELGQIFLKPLIVDALIPLFITTEKGHTYSLGLTTHELGAESIVLIPMGETSYEWQQSSSYETLVKELIQAMHTQTVLPGFVIERSKVKLPKIKGAKIVQLQSYLGQSLLGQVLEVSNTSSEPLHLIEIDFYLSGVRAVSILDKVLAPKAKTRVYWVRT